MIFVINQLLRGDVVVNADTYHYSSRNYPYCNEGEIEKLTLKNFPLKEYHRLLSIHVTKFVCVLIRRYIHWDSRVEWSDVHFLLYHHAASAAN